MEALRINRPEDKAKCDKETKGAAARDEGSGTFLYDGAAGLPAGADGNKAGKSASGRAETGSEDHLRSFAGSAVPKKQPNLIFTTGAAVWYNGCREVWCRRTAFEKH